MANRSTCTIARRIQLREILPKLEDIAILMLVGLIGFASTAVIERAGGPSIGIDGYIPNVLFFFLALVAFICGAVCLLLIRHKPVKPTQFLFCNPEGRELWQNVVTGMPLLIAVGFFMPSFSAIKSGIPLFNEYAWDDSFVALDFAIHGTDPWRLLQPVLGYPIVTALLAQLYHTWFLLIYAGTLFFAFAVKDRVLRYRYFISYFLMWMIGGMAMAIGFASVGPCFLEPILGNDHFAEQMAYLNAANEQYPVAVLKVQSDLIAWFEQGDYRFGRGISAMPSMHVALAFLFFLAIRHVSQIAGWFFGVFCFLITIASIYLAYHYAIDGYVSFALVSVIWVISGKLVPLIVKPSKTAQSGKDTPIGSQEQIYSSAPINVAIDARKISCSPD